MSSIITVYQHRMPVAMREARKAAPIGRRPDKWDGEVGRPTTTQIKPILARFAHLEDFVKKDTEVVLAMMDAKELPLVQRGSNPHNRATAEAMARAVHMQGMTRAINNYMRQPWRGNVEFRAYYNLPDRTWANIPDLMNIDLAEMLVATYKDKSASMDAVAHKFERVISLLRGRPTPTEEEEINVLLDKAVNT